jgi:hypothetical protein
MSKANMFEAKPREEWVTPEMEHSLRKFATSGELTCAQAMEFAKSHKIPMKQMKYLTDLFTIKLKSCQLGCF